MVASYRSVVANKFYLQSRSCWILGLQIDFVYISNRFYLYFEWPFVIKVRVQHPLSFTVLTDASKLLSIFVRPLCFYYGLIKEAIVWLFRFVF